MTLTRRCLFPVPMSASRAAPDPVEIGVATMSAEAAVRPDKVDPKVCVLTEGHSPSEFRINCHVTVSAVDNRLRVATAVDKSPA
jgi:hypothetical protein